MLSDYAYKVLVGFIFGGDSICPRCGDHYVRTSKRQVYCSQRCYDKAKRKKEVG